jgi:hypothetical protein
MHLLVFVVILATPSYSSPSSSSELQTLTRVQSTAPSPKGSWVDRPFGRVQNSCLALILVGCGDTLLWDMVVPERTFRRLRSMMGGGALSVVVELSVREFEAGSG